MTGVFQRILTKAVGSAAGLRLAEFIVAERNLVPVFAETAFRHRSIENEDPLSLRQVFRLAYGRVPAEPEIADILKILTWDLADSDSARLRRLIGSRDQHEMASRVTVRFDTSEIDLVGAADLQMLIDKSDAAVGRAIAGNAHYEPHLQAFIKTHVKAGMTAIDVGANIGFFSLLLSALVGEAGKVLAFEPGSENCRLIILNKTRNCAGNIEVFPFAAGDRFGAVSFTPCIGSNGNIDTDLSATVEQPNCTIVPVAPLDAIVTCKVDFIKLDIEGAEALALKGAARILTTDRPVVTCEFSLEMLRRVSGVDGGDFLRWMAGLGYRAVQLSAYGGAAQEIADVDVYMRDWGSVVRIEDIGFLPEELVGR